MRTPRPAFCGDPARIPTEREARASSWERKCRRVPRAEFPEVAYFAPFLRRALGRNPYETQGAGVLFGPPVLIAS